MTDSRRIILGPCPAHGGANHLRGRTGLESAPTLIRRLMGLWLAPCTPFLRLALVAIVLLLTGCGAVEVGLDPTPTLMPALPGHSFGIGEVLVICCPGSVVLAAIAAAVWLARRKQQH